ncbi:protein translocase subunit SecD [Oceanomicrobium pacificus]|uniref:Protein translocase subunit SecD n=1 Tax=Oceanomicrobium pacificus TaxID=2692916 RepID=A0A6B0TWJ5_9RHOB|nr:protein translocase subunit SecD [Oceanomicrobium pacificus]MXU65632.1 protein translocase subunit SecD [Oceanomicrobium pacificus]
MLNFPSWKKGLIVLICLCGVIFAMPNLFFSRVEQANDARALVETGATLTDEQAAALDGWPAWAPSSLVNLGLDLRGGAHLLVEVDVEGVYAERVEGYWPEVRDALGAMRDTVGTVRRVEGAPGELRVRIGNAEAMPQALAAVEDLSRPVVSLTGAGARDFDVTADGDELVLTLSEAEQIATDDRTMQQSLEIIRRRVDEAGTREPTIQRQGADRILVQVPGIGSAEELLALIGQTAKLSFNPVVQRTSDPDTRPGIGNLLLPSVDEPGSYYVVEKRAVVTGEELVDAQPSFDQNGAPAVNFRFNPSGGRKFGQYTAQNIGSPFAIVLDEEVISAPVIQSHIPGGTGIITGQFTVEDSTRLAVLLRAGALPAEIQVLEQRTIGPELGKDSIEAGKLASIIAFVAVLIFMILAYGLFGVFANVALLLNVAMVFALLSTIGATLTLPGIAGIILTIGMAVDANVLVFERIREELKAGRGPARAIEQGYEKAFSAIIDANVTTLIAAVILFAVGSGPVRGFAVTLGFGIVTSVFTAIWVTRLMIATWFARRRPKTLTV